MSLVLWTYQTSSIAKEISLGEGKIYNFKTWVLFWKTITWWCIVILLSAYPKILYVGVFHGIVVNVLNCDIVVSKFLIALWPWFTN